MRFNIISILPKIFDALCESKIFRSAIESEKISINVINPRNFTKDKHKTLDRPPASGGAGMVMMYEPLRDAITSVDVTGYRIHFSPRGVPLTQGLLSTLSKKYNCFTLICGRYEGIDQRFIDKYVDIEISMGDFVMTGGEIPALAFIDSISRLVPGVLGNECSTKEESFTNHRLEYDSYTKPNLVDELPIPEVLLQGNHQKISEWKMASSLYRTFEKRPDLLTKYPLSDKEIKFFRKILDK